MKYLIYNIFLTFVWLTLTMKVSVSNFIFGFIISYFVLWFVQRGSKKSKYFTMIKHSLSFLIIFIKEVIYGSLRIGYDIITPKHNMNPGIIAFPLDAKTDLEITLLANAITLTPGTTSLAVSRDKCTLYIYNVYIHKEGKDININVIKNGLEKKLLEVLR